MMREDQRDFKLIKAVPCNISNSRVRDLVADTKYKFRVWTIDKQGERTYLEESDWVETAKLSNGK